MLLKFNLEKGPGTSHSTAVTRPLEVDGCIGTGGAVIDQRRARDDLEMLPVGNERGCQVTSRKEFYADNKWRWNLILKPDKQESGIR